MLIDQFQLRVIILISYCVYACLKEQHIKNQNQINVIHAEVYLITKVYIHVKLILFWKNNTATLDGIHYT